MEKKWTGLISMVVLTAVIIGGYLFAYWEFAFDAGPFSFERLTYVSDVVLTPSGDFMVKLTLNHTGYGRTATISQILLDGKSANERNDVIFENVTGTALRPGQLENGIVILRRGESWTEGTVFVMTVVTLSGGEFSKTIVLVASPPTPLPNVEFIWITPVSQYRTSSGDFALLLNLTNEGGVGVTFNEVIAWRIPYGPEGDIAYEDIRGITLAPGGCIKGFVILHAGDILTHDVDVRISLRTVSGSEYSTIITLI